MKTLKIHIALIIVLIFNTTIKAQWNAVRFDEQNTFYHIYTVDTNTAFAVGQGQEHPFPYFLLKTVDGGLTWDSTSFENILGSPGYITSGTFLSGNTSFMSCWNSNKQQNVLLKTDNKGVDWIDITPDTTILGRIMHSFSDDQNGVIIDKYNTVLYRTNDGGRSWQKDTLLFENTATFLEGDIANIQFVSRDTGFAAVSHNSLQRTIDGGKTWEIIFKGPEPDFTNTFPIPSFVNGFDFVNSSVAYTNLGNKLYKTINGGNTWDTMPISVIDSANFVRDFDFVDELNGYLLSGKGEIFATTDGGQTWELEYAVEWGAYGPNVQLNALSFVDNTGFVVGSNGLIKKRKKSKATSVEIVGNSDELRVYPNPSKGILNVSLDEDQLNSIKILNLQGQVVLKQSVNEDVFTLDLSHMPKGIYLLETTNLLSAKTINKIILE